MIPIPIPDSLPSGSTRLSESPPRLDPSTIAILDSFLASKAEEEKRFNDLANQADVCVPGLTQDFNDEEGEDPSMISVDEYRLAFGEDWQLSQFWYSTAFATRLAKFVRLLCKPNSTIVFMSCPTAFVAFQHANPLDGARLFEYDLRFRVLAPKKFVHYDLNEPDKFPKTLRGVVDIVVADPPFLNETTNEKIIQTILQILHPTRGKLLLLTSPSIESVLDKLYDKPPLGPLRRTSLKPEHGRLANEFACWGSWNGAEIFGNDQFVNGHRFSLYH